MNAKHTPGPWVGEYTPGDYGEGRVYSRDGNLGIAIIEGPNWGAWRNAEDNGEAEFAANANLIAAAPEMLEALKESARCLEDVATGKGGWAWEEVLQSMQAAIAKAEGRP